MVPDIQGMTLHVEYKMIEKDLQRESSLKCDTPEGCPALVVIVSVGFIDIGRSLVRRMLHGAYLSRACTASENMGCAM